VVCVCVCAADHSIAVTDTVFVDPIMYILALTYSRPVAKGGPGGPGTPQAIQGIVNTVLVILWV